MTDHERERLALLIRERVKPDSLRSAVLNTDGEADWDWACAWLADWLAQELDGHVVLVPTEREAA